MAARQSSAQRNLRLVLSGGEAEERSEITDEQLVEAIERGDEKVAGVVYDRLIGVVEATLYRLLGKREADHDDLVQSAFEQILMTITRHKYARACSLRTWAATVASHLALNTLRARSRERKVFDRWSEVGGEDVVAAPQDVEREAGVRRDLDLLRSTLAELEQTKAITVLLHDALGYDLAEVAVLTGCSFAAAQSRLVRGRKELLERMDRARKRSGNGQEVES